MFYGHGVFIEWIYGRRVMNTEINIMSTAIQLFVLLDQTAFYRRWHHGDTNALDSLLHTGLGTFLSST